jgi:hypothetical protein
MIRCEMAGCVEMAACVAKYEDKVFGTLENDFCQNCANYLLEAMGLYLTITPYKNKGLATKN